MASHTRRSVDLVVSGTPLDGLLTVPENPGGLVVFASAQSGAQYATLERELCKRLHAQDIATLVMGLVSLEDSDDRAVRANTETLTRRLEAQLDLADSRNQLASLDVALCGLGTGAAATLDCLATGSHDARGAALVNGRVGLASASLSHITDPLLFTFDTDSDYLQRETETVYDRVGTSESEKHLLRTNGDGSLGVVTEWLGGTLSSDDHPPVSLPVSDRQDA